jgi:hypothetical protein
VGSRTTRCFTLGICRWESGSVYTAQLMQGTKSRVGRRALRRVITNQRPPVRPAAGHCCVAALTAGTLDAKSSNCQRVGDDGSLGIAFVLVRFQPRRDPGGGGRGWSPTPRAAASTRRWDHRTEPSTQLASWIKPRTPHLPGISADVDQACPQQGHGTSSSKLPVTVMNHSLNARYLGT